MSKGKKSSSKQGQQNDLDAFSEKLKAAQDHHDPKIDEEATGWAVGINYASVFTGAIIVGGAFGYGFDYFAATKPWGLMAGILIGFAAGTRSIVQMAKSMSEQDGAS